MGKIVTKKMNSERKIITYAKKKNFFKLTEF